MFKKKPYMRSMISTIAFAGLMLGITNSAAAFELTKNGKESCSGNVSVTNDTRYGLRNRNSSRTIRLDKIQVFDSNGNLAYNSDTDGFIPSIKTLLPPHNGTAFDMSALIAVGSGVYKSGPGQVEIEWTVANGKMGIPLGAGGKRVVINPTTGEILAERGQRCVSVPVGY